MDPFMKLQSYVVSENKSLYLLFTGSSDGSDSTFHIYNSIFFLLFICIFEILTVDERVLIVFNYGSVMAGFTLLFMLSWIFFLLFSWLIL